jgi:hypothetical protein
MIIFLLSLFISVILVIRNEFILFPKKDQSDIIFEPTSFKILDENGVLVKEELYLLTKEKFKGLKN